MITFLAFSTHKKRQASERKSNRLNDWSVQQLYSFGFIFHVTRLDGGTGFGFSVQPMEMLSMVTGTLEHIL